MIIELNTSFHKSTGGGSKQERKAKSLIDIAKWLGHNHRSYKNVEKSLSFIEPKDSHKNKYLKRKESYKDWFNSFISKEIIDKYNKGKKKIRQIKNYDYFDFIVNKPSQKQGIGEQLILQLGSDNELYWLKDMLNDDKDYLEYWYQYQKDITNYIQQIIPEFKIYDSSLHLDETSPHIHIIGIGFEKNKGKTGLEYKLSSTNLFTTDRLRELHKQFRNFNKLQVSKLQDLINNKNIYYDNLEQRFIRTTNPKSYHSKIELKANQENLRDRVSVKSKEIANVISNIWKGNYLNKDIRVLKDQVDSYLNENASKSSHIKEREY
ncbi:plasmid recombination protein [Mycoplasma sp. CSL10166]|uniref:plasmid recombination protein n=1 Tax=Mycoplasma sp. CSL10166 TaxID=2813825 RepID=UPI00197BDF93|nr:plasmid recombination protein [Mycoplasma sp. CSL10166]MBN4084700.1 plasmid recombination protein [Mycoplasma sp. CSL10166]